MNTYNLEDLAKSPIKMDRVIAAGHIDTDVEILQNLFENDPEMIVRDVAKRNLSRQSINVTNIKISPKSLIWLAKNPIPDDIAQWLCTHPDKEVSNYIDIQKSNSEDIIIEE